MRVALLSLFLLLAGVALGQTNKHLAVNGTKVSMVPPTGFVAATKYSGFEQVETGASILVTEIPGPYQQIVSGFTGAALATRGMTLLKTEPVDLQENTATLLQVKQTANGITYLKQMLVFGDQTKTVMVTGTYPEKNSGLGESIKEALLTSRYNVDQNVQQVARFSIDVTGTKFKFAKELAGSMLYTTDGKAPSESSDKAMMIVGNSLGNVAVVDKKQYSIDRLKQLPNGSTNKMRSVTSITINGLSGYEITADGKGSKEESQLVYQTMLFDNSGGYYVIVGLTSQNFDTHLALFKTIAKTFKRT